MKSRRLQMKEHFDEIVEETTANYYEKMDPQNVPHPQDVIYHRVASTMIRHVHNHVNGKGRQPTWNWSLVTDQIGNCSGSYPQHNRNNLLAYSVKGYYRSIKNICTWSTSGLRRQKLITHNSTAFRLWNFIVCGTTCNFHLFRCMSTIFALLLSLFK